MLRRLCLAVVLLWAFAGCSEIDLQAPEGFAVLDTDGQYAAMSPEGMVCRVRVMSNKPKQSLEFWSEALTNHLKKEGYLPLSSGNTFSSQGVAGSFSEWTVPHRNQTYKYLTGILVAEQTVAVAEASASHDVYDRHREALLRSLESVDFRGVRARHITMREVNAALASSPAKAAPAGGSGCFVAGTPVLTSDGARAIDALWPGTGLPVYDPASGSWSQQEVRRTVSLLYTGDLIRVQLGKEAVEVTGNHPFLVIRGRGLRGRPLPGELSAAESLAPAAGRWVEARHLRRGDLLLARSGRRLRVRSLAARNTTIPVYHLAVSGPHTYAVEPLGFVVHNGGEAERAKAPLASDQAARESEIIGAGAVSASLPPEARSERVRVYSGACSLVIDRVEQAKRQIAVLAERTGGYVEQSADRRIILRVPAGDFRTVFDQILELGEVLYKAIETYDVTDQFTDPAGRLAVAIKARDRLYVLLNRVEDPKERLEILKKIREYTETIEKLELSLKVLEQRIAMSRITVELKPRLEQGEDTERPIPFGWVERLHPLYETTGRLGGKAAVTLPDDVAVFQEGGVLRAEAADGTRIRIGTVVNNPRGDSQFWQQALIYHLGPRYKQAEPIGAGDLSMALFASKDRAPYYYLVGATPLREAAALLVFEAYFPDEAARDRHRGDLLGAFQQARVK